MCRAASAANRVRVPSRVVGAGSGARSVEFASGVALTRDTLRAQRFIGADVELLLNELLVARRIAVAALSPVHASIDREQPV